MSELWVDGHIKEVGYTQRTIYLLMALQQKINKIPVMWDLFLEISTKRHFLVSRLF